MFSKILLRVGMAALLLNVASCSAQESETPKAADVEAKQVKPTVETEKAEAEKVQSAAPKAVEQKQVAVDPCEFIVSVDGVKLTLEKIGWIEPRAARPDMAARFAEHWMDTQLLYEEALRRGLGNDEKLKFVLDWQNKKAYVDELIKQIRSDVKVTDEEITDYYEKNKESDPALTEPLRLTFSQVSCRTLKEAQEIRRRIDKGENINALAEQYSVDRDARRGGKVMNTTSPTIARRFSKELLNALLYASVGDIVGPIQVRRGFYAVARFEGKEESSIMPLEMAKHSIRMNLQSRAQMRVVDELLAPLKEKAKDRIIKSTLLLEHEENQRQIKR